MKHRRRSELVLTLAAAFFVAPLPAQDIGSADVDRLSELMAKRGYSPYAGRAYPTRVFWGDTHLHTGFL